MSETHICDIKLDKCPRFRLSRIKEIKVINFITEINDREIMRKTLNKYITAHEYANRILFVLSGESSDVSLYSFTTANGTPIGIAIASISLLFLTSNEIVKMLFKAMRKKKTKAKKKMLCCTEAI